MKRLAFLFAGGALWLFVAALPALADGGPHVKILNNGSAGLTSDNCAGCHRAHIAQGAFLLKEEEPAHCLSCHGTSGTGATTNVADGVQYALAAAGGDTLRGAELGALRGGGFVQARIGSGSAVGLSYATVSSGVTYYRRETKVPALATGQAITSAHLNVTTPGTSTAWGNGALNSGAGATGVTLECTNCHNPHGNGNYRILNPMPSDGTGPLVEATTSVAVTDAPLTAAIQAGTDARNYTIIQVKGTADYIDIDDTSAYNWQPNPAYDPASYLLTASQVAAAQAAGGYGATAGDYLHRKVPWNAGNQVAGTSSAPSANDAPNGLPSTFNAQINAWCATCHTRYTTSTTALTSTTSSPSNNSAIAYPRGSGPYNTDSGDTIFKYRHSTTSNKPCTTCHVAHGSNAQMTGFNSTHESYPAAGGSANDPTVAANADSRLLKADNRGTCQLCHDPTSTATSEGVVFPTGATVPSYP